MSLLVHHSRTLRLLIISSSYGVNLERRKMDTILFAFDNNGIPGSFRQPVFLRFSEIRKRVDSFNDPLVLPYSNYIKEYVKQRRNCFVPPLWISSVPVS
jgi:hypothetical protein